MKKLNHARVPFIPTFLWSAGVHLAMTPVGQRLAHNTPFSRQQVTQLIDYAVALGAAGLVDWDLRGDNILIDQVGETHIQASGAKERVGRRRACTTQRAANDRAASRARAWLLSAEISQHCSAFAGSVCVCSCVLVRFCFCFCFCSCVLPVRCQSASGDALASSSANLLKIDLASVFPLDAPCPFRGYHGTMMFGHTEILQALGTAAALVSAESKEAPWSIFSSMAAGAQDDVGGDHDTASCNSSSGSDSSSNSFPIRPREQHTLYSVTATVLFFNAMSLPERARLRQMKVSRTPEGILAFWATFRRDNNKADEVFQLAENNQPRELNEKLNQYFGVK